MLHSTCSRIEFSQRPVLADAVEKLDNFLKPIGPFLFQLALFISALDNISI
jgi:hypothetical protein